MADNFGLKIGLEGEREFKKALAEINSQFKVLGSEMKLVDSAFDKNSTSIESLTAKNGVLTKEIEAQRKKVETLERALQNASDSFGENDRRTQSWQIQLNNAKATLNNMERELKENTEAIEQHGKAMSDAADDADDLSDSLEDSGDKAEDAGGKFSKIGSIAKGMGAALAAAVAAIGAAAVATGVQLVKLGDEYNKAINQIGASTVQRKQSLPNSARSRRRCIQTTSATVLRMWRTVCRRCRGRLGLSAMNCRKRRSLGSR